MFGKLYVEVQITLFFNSKHRVSGYTRQNSDCASNKKKLPCSSSVVRYLFCLRLGFRQNTERKKRGNVSRRSFLPISALFISYSWNFFSLSFNCLSGSVPQHFSGVEQKIKCILSVFPCRHLYVQLANDARLLANGSRLRWGKKNEIESKCLRWLIGHNGHNILIYFLMSTSLRICWNEMFVKSIW